MSFFSDNNETLILNVRIVPRASNDSIVGTIGNELKIRIQAPPLEGKANAYLIKFLSKKLKIPRASIKLISGETCRTKRVQISSPSNELRKTLLSIQADKVNH